VADAAPIVAAIEPQTAHATADAAARLARDLGAPLVFVNVLPRRRAALEGPSGAAQGTRDLIRSRKALDAAFAAARGQGVTAYGEIVEGDAATEIVEFAHAQSARFLVVGRRGRRSCTAPSPSRRPTVTQLYSYITRGPFAPGVSRRVIGGSDLPVVVAASAPRERDRAGAADRSRLG
jgi:nucleotide-binding universal stress UspA family protein